MHLNPPTNPPPPGSRTSGFSLIELVAVLAILGILATAAASSTITRMKRTARQTEATNMANIADALRSYFQLTRSVPVATNWPSVIANQMSSSVDRVQRTTGGYNRFYALDPAAQLGPTAGASLPFVQDADGSLEPASARIVIVSSLGATLPTFQMTSTNFATIWNAPDGTIPSVFTNYGAAREELRIQRLDLRELFYRVILTSLDPANSGVYSIDNPTNTTSIAVGQRVERWFMATTPLNLHFADGSLQARDILRSDLSYVFENGRWTRYLNYGRQAPLSDFGVTVQQFLNTPAPAFAQGGVTPSAIVQEFMVYLSTYATWSSGGSPFPSGGDTSTLNPTLRILRDSQQRLDDFTSFLLPAASN